MSTTVTIPLDKNPEVADLVTDLSPGDKVYGRFSIRAKDDQSLELRIEEMAATRDELSEKDHDSDEEDDESVDEGDKGTTDKDDGDDSNDEERESARGLSGY